MASGMEEHTVLYLVPASLAPLLQMMLMPATDFGDLLVTEQAVVSL
jgi:hypothetical protein